MPKLTPLTYDEHKEVAAKVHTMREIVTHLQSSFSRAFGVTSKEYKFICSIDGDINKLRDRLDERAYKEAPANDKQEALQLYYPGGPRPLPEKG